MDLQGIGRVVIVAGLALAVLGLVIWFGGRLGLGSLPGDLRLGDEDWGCYVPIASMILLSVVLTIVVNVLLRLFDR
ncbi:MAG: DUF2905 domain-containing protein [Anaerosomatales bacterium]|nr:DUF2905 domain-containing protein [Coriobacteriia bacterium]